MICTPLIRMVFTINEHSGTSWSGLDDSQEYLDGKHKESSVVSLSL